MKFTFLFKAIRGTSVFVSFPLKGFMSINVFISFSCVGRFDEVWSFQVLLVAFVYFFLKNFIKIRVLKVILFWELWQQTDILVVFAFKVYMRSAVFRFFYSFYTFLFRDLIRTLFFTYVFKDLMSTGVFRVFSFVFIFSLKDFMDNKNFIRFSCQRFYEIQSF